MFDISLFFIFQSTSSLSEMKKSSGLKNVGGDTGKLIVYSDPDFQGEEHTFLGLYVRQNYISQVVLLLMGQ